MYTFVITHIYSQKVSYFSFSFPPHLLSLLWHWLASTANFYVDQSECKRQNGKPPLPSHRDFIELGTQAIIPEKGRVQIKETDFEWVLFLRNNERGEQNRNQFQNMTRRLHITIYRLFCFLLTLGSSIPFVTIEQLGLTNVELLVVLFENAAIGTASRNLIVIDCGKL